MEIFRINELVITVGALKSRRLQFGHILRNKE
uniref:Uncharacterized protein n=1 Tax=Lepeophtheirus salmonis TaxID=72036 RepID=A0A0K2VA01_LEPSM